MEGLSKESWGESIQSHHASPSEALDFLATESCLTGVVVVDFGGGRFWDVNSSCVASGRPKTKDKLIQAPNMQHML